MADIKLRIEVNPNAESEFLGTITNDNARISNTSINTGSINQFIDVPTTEFDGSNGLVWANEDYLVFNDNDELDNVENSGGYVESEENPVEFFWGIVPESKEYSVKLTFTGAKNLKDIIVFGDKLNNQFPTEAIIDGTTTIYSDDYKWAINLGTESDKHTIEFTKWNRANYNACLTLVRVMLRYWEVNKLNGLKSVESLSQSTGQPKEIFYGIVPNSGSAEVVDVNGEIADMVRDGVMPNSNVRVEVFANDKKVQEHITTDSVYTNKILNIEMENKLSKWETIKIKPKKFEAFGDTYYEILLNVLTESGYKLEEIDNMLNSTIRVTFRKNDFTKLNKNMTVAEYLSLQRVGINEAYTQTDNLRDLITEMCKITQLTVLENSNGEIKFVSNRPISYWGQKTVVVPKRLIQGTPEKELVPKNKYNNIKIDKNILHTDISQFYNQEYYVRDSEENLLIDNLGDNVQIINISGQNFLCFFKTIKGTLDMLRLKMFYGLESAIELTFKDKNKNIIGSYGSGGFASSDKLIEDFDFNNADISTILTKYSGINQETLAIKFPYTSVVEDLSSVYYITISVSGYNMALSTLEYTPNSNSNIYEYGSNGTLINDKSEFRFGLNDGSLVTGSIYSLIEQNVLDDYKNGVDTSKISVCCQNLYFEDGTLAKDWNSGDIIEVGDILRIDRNNDGDSLWVYDDGNPIEWKVTGRNFRKVGVPMIDLELQQVIRDEMDYVTISPEGITTSLGTGYSITMECYTKEAKIYYTLDGTEPNKNSILYTEPFNIVSNVVKDVTIRAIGIDGNRSSPEETRYDLGIGY